MAIAGLVLSILGLIFILCSWIFFWSAPVAGVVLSFVALVAAVTGLVLCSISRKKNPDGISTAGFVVGLIGTIIAGVTFCSCAISCIACYSAYNRAMDYLY